MTPNTSNEEDKSDSSLPGLRNGDLKSRFFLFRNYMLYNLKLQNITSKVSVFYG